MSGTFTAGRNRDQEDHLSEIRQKVVDGLHRALTSATFGQLFPGILMEALTNKIWAHPRKLDYKMAQPMPLMEFVTTNYPHGLGTTVDVIERLIAGNEKVMLAWDQAVRGEHGGAHNPNRDPETGRLAPAPLKTDNVRLEDDKAKRHGLDYGNSADAGIRRLDKAAQAGDNKAADMLKRVTDPNDAMTVHGACVVMGWRKPTITVVDTTDGITDAAVRKAGALKTVQRAWARANQSEREAIAAWIDEQMSPTQASRFR